MLQHMMGHGLPEPEIANNKQYNNDDTNDRKDVHTPLLWLRGLSLGHNEMDITFLKRQLVTAYHAPTSRSPRDSMHESN
jgi:hypothetical protein